MLQGCRWVVAKDNWWEVVVEMGMELQNGSMRASFHLEALESASALVWGHFQQWNKQQKWKKVSKSKACK